ncbi:hypothetical protein MVES1_003679 [Malassezia vespertilionis]|uniref:uncharacterized protein n=1 Tax=Malassezia vespertilionis TaxID=2020962 RepID=UPI0024B1513A|nr:uncharacterized protein MVES1_003679 [Malassezia vespertilionis]WFD08307.1 hypothetical protein MVES1_003679 [Malassezia vespertilionis]
MRECAEVKETIAALSNNIALSQRSSNERARLHLEPRDALHDVREALRLAPNDPEHLYLGAKVFVRTGYCDKALRLLRTAAKHAPSEALRARIEKLVHAVHSKSQSRKALPAPVWARLPHETILAIFSFLDTPMLLRCIGVCRKWRSLAMQSAPLWHTVAIPSVQSGEKKERVHRQYTLLAFFMQRARAHLSCVTIGRPLADTESVQKMLCRADTLVSLSVECAADKAGAWAAFALTFPRLTTLSIQAAPAHIHPWMQRPLDTTNMHCGPLKSLCLYNTPPLAADVATLRLCAKLARLTYGASEHAGSLRTVRELTIPALQALVHAAQDTLVTLELDSDAIWGADAFAHTPRIAQAQPPHFPVLRSLQAPLKCMVLHTLPDVAVGVLVPALATLHLQVSIPRAAGGTAESILAFAQATCDSVRHLTLRITSDSATWLVASLLHAWRHLESVHIVYDEPVSIDEPMLEREETTLDRPLTAALLVRLLTPRAFCRLPPLLCPALRTLGCVNDGTLRGRELLECVGIRALLAKGCSLETARRAVLEHRTLDAVPDGQGTAHAAALEQLELEMGTPIHPEFVARLQQHLPRLLWKQTRSERRGKHREQYL